MRCSPGLWMAVLLLAGCRSGAGGVEREAFNVLRQRHSIPAYSGFIATR